MQGYVPASLWLQPSSTNLHRTLFDVFLLKNTLFHIYFWFINTDLMASSNTTQPEWSWSDTHIFSLRHITVLLYRGRDSISARRSGIILNCEVINQKHRNENVTLSRRGKGHMFVGWELKQEGGVGPHLALCASHFFGALHISVNDHGSTVSTDLGVMNKF